MRARTTGGSAAVAGGSRATRSVAVQGGRRRWRMGVDARALVIVTAALLAFGVAAGFIRARAAYGLNNS